MRMRSGWFLLVAVPLTALLAVGGYWLWYESHSADHWRARGEDPIILENQNTLWAWTRDDPAPNVGGVLRHDRHTDCLLLELDPSIEVRGPGDELLRHPLHAPVVWPKGTRPLQTSDGERGVAVGSFLGRFGGRPLLEGETLWGVGHVAVAVPDTHLLTGPCDSPDGVIAFFTHSADLIESTG